MSFERQITEKVGKRGLKRREWSVKAEWHFPHLAGPGVRLNSKGLVTLLTRLLRIAEPRNVLEGS